MSHRFTYDTQDFLERLYAGHQVELQLAALIRSWGFDCADPELEVAKDLSEISRFTREQKDLTVGNLTLEVKSNKLKFTGPGDYPYDSLIIDSKSGYDQKVQKPDLYVIVSRETPGGIICLETAMQHLWDVKTIPDRKRNMTYAAYICPRSLFKDGRYLHSRIKDSVF